MSKIAVVVLNYNDALTTEEYLDQVENYKVLDMIVVVDNHSTDDSYKRLKKRESKKIHVIQTKKNGGYGYGNNCGIEYVDQKLGKSHLIISNPDIVVEEKVIKKLKKVADEFPKIAIVGPTIIEHGIKNRGWKILTPRQAIKQNLPITNKTKYLTNYEESCYTKDSTTVDVVSGCFFLMNQETRNQFGKFDEQVFLYYEENIMATQIKELGLTEVILNDEYIIHNHSVSIDGALKKASKFKILKKSQMYYETHYNHANLLERFLLFITGKLVLLKIYIWK